MENLIGFSEVTRDITESKKQRIKSWNMKEDFV